MNLNQKRKLFGLDSLDFLRAQTDVRRDGNQLVEPEISFLIKRKVKKPVDSLISPCLSLIH